MPSPSGGRLGVLFLLATHLALATPESDWADCPSPCKCKWSNGRKLADCTGASFSAVPNQLSPEIQWLDLNDNNFQTLPKDTFRDVGLVNLQKLYLKNCNIEKLDKEAFRGLVLLIEIDLSDNLIAVLHPSTFKENFRLRIFNFNRNPLEKLENDLFTNHTFLQAVELSECRLQHIAPKTFSNVPVLQQLKLDGNQLQYLRVSTFTTLTKLKSLVLAKNPWRCDCKLRQLRDWVVERKLYAQPTTCLEPERLKDKFWNMIPSEDFACRPQLVLPSTSVAAYPGNNATLSCRAAGDPTPEVRWVLNSLVLSNSTRPSHAGYKQRYLIHRGESRNHLGEYWVWTNLTIVDVKHYDAGKYSCGAKNPGGVAEEILTLGVREGRGGFIMSGETDTLWTWLVALVITAFLLLIFVFLLCYCLCRRKKRRNQRSAAVIKKHDTLQLTSNGDINLNGDDDPEKALITKKNPIQKPPRRLESTQSSLNGSQGGDLGRENNSVIQQGSAGDQSGDLLLGRSFDSLDSGDPEPSKQVPVAASKPSRPDSRTYPDLLAFPPRGHDSPAGSSTSTVPDGTRLPLQMHSPQHHGFGTLPLYNRSHSPFSPVLTSPPAMMGSCGSLPIVTPRQGYVTIPRRPRAPSWAAPPRPGDPLLKIEPIYDNLGPRTTADGSSVLSLNKAGENGTLPRNRSHVRPLPSSPQPLPVYYAPIEEVEHVPSPAPTRHQIRTSPQQRVTSPTRQMTSPEHIMSPTRNVISPTRQITSPTRQVISPTRKSPITKKPLTAPRPSSLIQTDGPRKVPPKVPPKPKKKQLSNGGSENGSEPLYEAEGEDGTEV